MSTNKYAVLSTLLTYYILCHLSGSTESRGVSMSPVEADVVNLTNEVRSLKQTNAEVRHQFLTNYSLQIILCLFNLMCNFCSFVTNFEVLMTAFESLF